MHFALLSSSSLCRVKPRQWGILGSFLLLSACAVGTDYTPPKNNLEEHWDALSVDQESTPAPDDPDAIPASAHITVSDNGTLPPGPWWKQFGDDTLSGLIDKALANNHDLKLAQARIAEAQAGERYATAQLFPEIDATGSITRETLPIPNFYKWDYVRQGGLNGNWDIDPFGGNRRQREAAVAFTQATKENFAQARLNLITEVAMNYSHLRAAQAQYELILRNLNAQRGTLRITRALRKAQDVTELDVARVQAQISDTQSRLPLIRTELHAAVNRLSVLTGQQPSALHDLLASHQPMLSVPDNLVVLSPVDTISQRPDVHAAERQLAQASALSNAAFAQLFPRISISAFFGSVHDDIYGSWRSWSGALSGLLPLLDFGRIRAQIHSADARQEQAFQNYQQAVLLALEDTENNLNAYMDERRRSVMLRNVAVEQERAVGIAREQYRGGIVTQLDLLDAERNQLDAQSNWVLSQQNATDDLIQLYRALGLAPAQIPSGDPPVQKADIDPPKPKADTDPPPQEPKKAQAADPLPAPKKTQADADPPPAMPSGRKPFADNPASQEAGRKRFADNPVTPISADASPPRSYIIYAGQFAVKEHAQRLADSLSAAMPVYMDQVKLRWVVHTGLFSSWRSANHALEQIRAAVPDAYIGMA